MKLAIMQPYVFPYIGYFQLIHSVENFVVYDDIEYTKKGWINRNRILLNGADHLFSLPLKKDSDYLSVYERSLAENFDEYKKKFKGQLISAYKKSPEFKTVYPLIESCFDFNDKNLFNFIFHSLTQVCNYLGITTQFILSSSLPNHKSHKGEDKVIAINKELGASIYINAIGGQELYDRQKFQQAGIELKFIQSHKIEYNQLTSNFVPHLSIIDVLMFNTKEQVQGYLKEYTLI